jgi:hypothetical protein
MKANVILENNRLIAEFMGLLKGTHSGLPPYWVIPTEDNCQGEAVMLHELIKEEDLKYHSSWDWLMPVVGKITSTNEEPEELDNLRVALLCADLQTAFSEVCNILSNDFINL